MLYDRGAGTVLGTDGGISGPDDSRDCTKGHLVPAEVHHALYRNSLGPIVPPRREGILIDTDTAVRCLSTRKMHAGLVLGSFTPLISWLGPNGTKPIGFHRSNLVKIIRLGTFVLAVDLLLLGVLGSPVLANTQLDETETDSATDGRLTLDEMEAIFLEYPGIRMNPNIQQPFPTEKELRIELNAIASLSKSVEFSVLSPQNPGHVLNSLQSPVQSGEPDPVAQEYSCKARWWDLAAYGYIQHDMELYVQNGFLP